jgi:hypothetical protein
MNEPEPPTLGELSDLADELLEQATEIRRQWAELAEVLGAEVAARREEHEEAEPGIGDEATTPAETVRLVAIDMLLTGRTRDEIAAYLRDAFDQSEAEAEAVVEQVVTDFDR